jgi:ADP-heptose:LPS heptosyltransferase
VILKKDPKRHFIDATIDTAATLGAFAEARSPKFYLSQDEQRWAENWLKENRIASDAPIGIHPGAHYPTQRWPSEYYAALIETVGRSQDRPPVILFAGPGDEEIYADIVARVSCTLFPCPAPNLRHFLALVSRCRILICNNSGPLHLAVAAGVPTLSTMGPTEKEVWQPRGEDHMILRRDELPCIGCNSGYCLIRTHACMREITPEMMMEALSIKLKRKAESA